MKKTAMSLAIVFGVAFICMAVAGVRSMQVQPPTEYGSLKWRIQQAKQKGEQQLQIASLICYGSEFRNPDEALKEALSYFSVIVAEPIEKKTYVNSDSLNSWYRFRVIETLNSKTLEEDAGCSNPCDPPGDMGPVSEDEILIVQAGGAMVLDDFYVVDTSSKAYSLSQKYLIFLRLDPTKRTGAITLGPAGVFTIDNEGVVESITTETNALKKHILKHYCNSLDGVRAGIQRELNFSR